MKKIAALFASLGMLCFVLGYLGQFGPAFDVLAIARWPAFWIACLLVPVQAWLTGYRVLAAVALAGLIAVGLGHRTSTEAPGGDIRVYTKNMLHSARDTAPLAADILKTAPQIVLLQEVSSQNGDIITALQTALPHQVICPLQGWNGMAILSRWPFADDTPRCSDLRSLMAIQVQHPDHPFWVVNVHLQQPWPDAQWRHLWLALPVIDDLTGPVIAAGDFNTVPWSAAAQKIGELNNTQPIAPAIPTFWVQGLWGLPLDQIWAAGGAVQRRPKFGSDHFGLVADVWLVPPT